MAPTSSQGSALPHYPGKICASPSGNKKCPNLRPLTASFYLLPPFGALQGGAAAWRRATSAGPGSMGPKPTSGVHRWT